MRQQVKCPFCSWVWFTNAKPDRYGKITCPNCYNKIRP